jgi:hypothetical protein
MIRRLVASVVRWAIGPEIDAVQVELDEFKKSMGKSIFDIGMALEGPSDETVTVAYFVHYEFTFQGKHPNSPRMLGSGSTELSVSNGGIKSAVQIRKMETHLVELIEPQYLSPSVRITNFIELRRWNETAN